MFDISFGEVLVLVTGAGLLLGRRELVEGSRLLGRGLGKLIGTLQGLRIRFDEQTKGTELASLHTSVRRGISDMSMIGTDILSIGIGQSVLRPARSDFAVSSMMPQRPAPVNPIASANSNSIYNTTSASQHSHVNHEQTQFTSRDNANADITRLTRLILAEQELNKRSGKPIISTSDYGSDLIQDVVAATTLNAFYSLSLKSQSNLEEGHKGEK